MTWNGKLVKSDRDALEAVRGGADVYDYGIAKTLRALESTGLVNIVKAGVKIHGTKLPPSEARQPYFGAILTVKGHKRLLRA
jgi:hypothetical protein